MKKQTLLEADELGSAPLHPTCIGRLDLAAASGLVAHGGRLYVIADDHLDLHIYGPLGGVAERRIPLFSGGLPADAVLRKEEKPDLETLVLLPGDQIVAMGSGSTPRRQRGALFDIATERVVPFDMGSVYVALLGALPSLNIEGAAMSGSTMYLLHRNNGGGRSAIIELDGPEFVRAAQGAGAVPAGVLRCIREVELGSIAGVPLGFTDASALPDGRLVFSAAAELSAGTYHDGPVAGSALGLLSPSGEVLALHRVLSEHKIEGVAASLAQGRIDARLVADADDPKVMAELLSVCF